MARELHDEANQLLAALMTTVDAAEAAAARQGQPELTTTLARLRRLASATLSDLQRIATELRPPALDEFGLLPALTRHVRDRTADTALEATVDTEGRPRRLPATVEVALYRIAQEALANVQKHSDARRVRLRLRFLPGAVRLDVTDDGVGFAARRRGRRLPVAARDRGDAGARQHRRRLAPGDQPPRRRDPDLHQHPARRGGAGERPWLSAIRVLLVDDHAMFREGVRSLLEARARPRGGR